MSKITGDGYLMRVRKSAEGIVVRRESDEGLKPTGKWSISYHRGILLV